MKNQEDRYTVSIMSDGIMNPSDGDRTIQEFSNLKDAKKFASELRSGVSLSTPDDETELKYSSVTIYDNAKSDTIYCQPFMKKLRK